MKNFLCAVVVLLSFLPLYGAAQVGFNRDGFVTNVPNNSFAYFSVALQADGKIVAVGRTDDDNGLIARFNINGELDQNFNGTGFINTEGNTNSFAYYSVALQADGKIVAVGAIDLNNNQFDGLIARFNPNGELDQNFNGTGFITNIPNNSWDYNSVVVQPDGKIVAVGQTDNSDGLIARFNTDGSLDQDFGDNGVIDNMPNNSLVYHSVALQADGKIVAVGRGNNDNGLIARFLSNGVLDAESKSNLKIFREYARNNNIPIALLG